MLFLLIALTLYIASYFIMKNYAKKLEDISIGLHKKDIFDMTKLMANFELEDLRVVIETKETHRNSSKKNTHMNGNSWFDKKNNVFYVGKTDVSYFKRDGTIIQIKNLARILEYLFLLSPAILNETNKQGYMKHLLFRLTASLLRFTVFITGISMFIASLDDSMNSSTLPILMLTFIVAHFARIFILLKDYNYLMNYVMVQVDNRVSSNRTAIEEHQKYLFAKELLGTAGYIKFIIYNLMP